LNKDFQASACI